MRSSALAKPGASGNTSDLVKRPCSSLFVVLLLGCTQEPGVAKVDYRRVKPPVAGGTVIARFGHDQVTDAELSERFAEMNPYARTRFQTAEARRDYIDGLVRFELLSQEAIRRGLASDPEVVESAKRVMVQQLLRRELDEKPSAISDSQINEYYRAHKSDYVKPVMTRLSHISFSKAHRAQAEETLKEVLALAPNDFDAFGTLARERSEEPRTKVLDGDLRYLSDDELTAQYGEGLAEAAAGLTQPGAVVPSLVETQTALHIVKLQNRQIALNLGVEQAKASIQQVLLASAKQERFKALLKRLEAEAKLEVNEAALAAMKVDVKAPAVEAKTPQPGYLSSP